MSGSANGMTNHTDPDVLKLFEQVGINRIELFETFGLIDRIFKAGLLFVRFSVLIRCRDEALP